MADRIQAQNMSYLPAKVQTVARSWLAGQPQNQLLKRSLDTPDWSLEQLWEVAVWHHLNAQHDKALSYYRRLIDWTADGSPQQGEVLQAIGDVFIRAGRIQDAYQILSQAYQLSPDPGQLFLLAECQLRLGREPEAYALLERLIRSGTVSDLPMAKAYLQLIRQLDLSGRAEAARGLLAEAAGRFNSWGFAIQAQAYQPLLPSEPALPELPALTPGSSLIGIELEEWYFARSYWRSHPSRAEAEAAVAPLSRQLQALLPAQSLLPGSQRICIVGAFHRPEAEPWLEAIIALSRRFSVTLIATGEVPPLLRQEEWLRVIHAENQLLPLHQTIVAQAASLLIYLGIGPGNPVCGQLASLRLAPVQVNLGCFPVTSGLSQLDYFLGFDWLETPEAAQNYSEQLVRLAGTPLQTVNLPDRYLGRESFRLEAQRRHYLCPMTPTGLHADFVPVLAQLLDQDPEALILMPGHLPALDQRFLQQFRAASPRGERLQIIPPLGRLPLLSLCREVELILDPIHFGLSYGLWNLLPIGTPIVTWPSDQARGRMAAALYRRLGVEDSIAVSAEDYVQRAIALASDPEARAAFRTAVQAALPGLFDFVAFRESFEAFVASTLQGAPEA